MYINFSITIACQEDSISFVLYLVDPGIDIEYNEYNVYSWYDMFVCSIVWLIWNSLNYVNTRCFYPHVGCKGAIAEEMLGSVSRCNVIFFFCLYGQCRLWTKQMVLLFRYSDALGQYWLLPVDAKCKISDQNALTIMQIPSEGSGHVIMGTEYRQAF